MILRTQSAIAGDRALVAAAGAVLPGDAGVDRGCGATVIVTEPA